MWMKMNSDGGNDPVLLTTPLKDGVLLDCHGDSKIGRLRTINQDRFFITSFSLKTTPEQDHADRADPGHLLRSTGYLFGVADGVGGAPAGERASLLVVGTLKAFIQEESSGLLRPGRPDGEIVETLSRGLKRCQAALAEEVRRHP